MSNVANTRQIRFVRRTSSYWRVTFDNPPLNIFGPETIPELNEIVIALETDEDVKVVVFDSAVEGFFLTHYNFLAKLEDTTSLPPGPTGLSPLPDMLVRLSRAPVVSIVSIRGRATGVGSELALASDMRFASREKTILSQWEVGAGLVPGGGPMARLPRLMGRGRGVGSAARRRRYWRPSRRALWLHQSCFAGRRTRCFCRRTGDAHCFVRQTGHCGNEKLCQRCEPPPPTQKLPPSGTHVLLLFNAHLPRRESIN
jgi:hypothetical protein